MKSGFNITGFAADYQSDTGFPGFPVFQFSAVRRIGQLRRQPTHNPALTERHPLQKMPDVMPSLALTRWQSDRMPRLGHMDAHCTSMFAPPAAGPVAAPALLPPLAQESLQAYAMLLSGHFQGFCRDLYTECTQICGAAVPPGLRTTIQAQFASELRLNSKNPTVENIRKDFERFGFARSGRGKPGQSGPNNPSGAFELLA